MENIEEQRVNKEQEVQEQSQPSNNDESGFNIKTFLPIALAGVLIIIAFFKFVLPALEPNPDHAISPLLEPTEESQYELLFGTFGD